MIYSEIKENTIRFYMAEAWHLSSSVPYSGNVSQLAFQFFFQMFLYDSKTYEKIGQFGDPAHDGGVYGVSVVFALGIPQSVMEISHDSTCYFEQHLL